MSEATLATLLENYTLKHPQEVLLVHLQVGEDVDQVMIFKGFSSSLMRPTAYDPEVPVIPSEATIVGIDRLKGPYQPQAPQYIERDLTLQAFLKKLEAQ